MRARVKIGSEIVVDFITYKVIKIYSEGVWQLKSETGEYVNVFYANENLWAVKTKK